MQVGGAESAHGGVRRGPFSPTGRWEVPLFFFRIVTLVDSNFSYSMDHEQGNFDQLTMRARCLTIAPGQGHVSRSGVFGSAGCQVHLIDIFLFFYIFLYFIIFVEIIGYALFLAPTRRVEVEVSETVLAAIPSRHVGRLMATKDTIE